MLQMICADWTVRFFLLYLVLVGGLTLMRRQRPDLSSPFDFLVLADMRDRWTGRETRAAALRGMWLNDYGNKEGYQQRRDDNIRVWKMDRDGLGYA